MGIKKSNNPTKIAPKVEKGGNSSGKVAQDHAITKGSEHRNIPPKPSNNTK